MGKRIYDYNAYARAAGWQPAPRPVQRIPVHETTEADIRRESMQLFYGQCIHDGHDEQAAHELTIQHFAVADHATIGAIREEE